MRFLIVSLFSSRFGRTRLRIRSWLGLVVVSVCLV